MWVCSLSTYMLMPAIALPSCMTSEQPSDVLEKVPNCPHAIRHCCARLVIQITLMDKEEDDYLSSMDVPATRCNRILKPRNMHACADAPCLRTQGELQETSLTCKGRLTLAILHMNSLSRRLVRTLLQFLSLNNPLLTRNWLSRIALRSVSAFAVTAARKQGGCWLHHSC